MLGAGRGKGRYSAAVGRTALLEQLIYQINIAHRHACKTYHRSELAENSLANAETTVTEIVKELALGKLDHVDRLHNVAWFYAKFARDIVSAENTEHLLGQGRFFDLIEPRAKVGAQMSTLIDVLSLKLDDLEESIPLLWEVDESVTDSSAESPED